MYSINPTQPTSQETAEWGCFYGFGYRSYNFSLGLGFSAGQDRDRPCCRTWERLRRRASRQVLPLPL